MSRFDRVILATVLGLALPIAVLSVASARFGPAVDAMRTAQTLDGTAINTQIALTFTDRMNVQSVERAFRIVPSVRGDFNWSGNTLLFSPRTSLSYATTYRVTVAGTATDSSGKRLFHAFHEKFTTQHQHLLYLGSSGAERNRLVMASTTGQQQVVGNDDGSVTDFSVSLDRSLVVYTRRGSAGSRSNEIWLLSVLDRSTQRIFRHADWSISAPHLAPDGRYVAFLATNVVLCRKYYGCFRNTTSPVIYLLDLRTHRAKPFQSATDVPITNFLDFSPAGQLAFTDLGSALTLADPSGNRVSHVPNLGNSLEYVGFDPQGDKAAFVGQTPDSTGGDVLVYTHGRYTDVSKHIYDSSTPAFASSGKSLAYVAYRGEQGIEPIYGVNVYNMSTGRTQHLTNERTWSDWAPAWSPDDRYIAFIRSRPQEAMYMGTGKVWVMKSDGSDAHPIGGPGSNVHWVM